MQFSTTEDIEAPIEQVFASISDFDAFERTALRRGVSVQYTGSVARKGVGMTWDIGFLFRGKPRRMTAELTKYDPMHQLVCASTSDGLSGTLKIELLALSARRTRLSVELQLFPKTLSARLMVQSLKLAKSGLNRRFAKRVGDFAADVESKLNPLLY
jgi:carbon monoxide dehydrogenase subunit G